MHFVHAKHLLSAQNGINVYRGCTHGCIYCDSRSRCYQLPHDFEDVEVKINAPELLEQELRRKRKRCMIGTGAMCDPYLHAEEKLELTRQCLKVIDRNEFGVSVLTKSARILRDADLLDSINRKAKTVVQMTLTTYEERLCRIVEPNVSTTKERFEVLMEMKKRGIPTMVWLCPILPQINDSRENLEGILEYCRQAEVKGIVSFGIGMTLREGNREYYYAALNRSFPGLKQQYMRTYGDAYEIPSRNGTELETRLQEFCRENRMLYRTEDCFAYLEELPERYVQESIFE